MEGACRTWGISGQVVPLASLITPREAAWDTHQAAQRWTQEAVEGHREFSGDLLARRAAVRETAAAWWDGVLVGLSGALPGPGQVPEVPAAGAGTEFSRVLRRDWTDPQAQVPEGSAASVAIIMRTKDRPLLLERALDDVLAQTLADWRLVIVNDGGDPEPVRRLVEAREQRFRGRCRILSHRRSVGMEAASNRGLAASDSEFVVIHDDDDTWDPQFLQRAVAFLERPSCTDAGVMARTEIVYEQIDDRDGEKSVRETGRALFWAEQSSITLSELLSINRGVPICFLYRRSLHGLVGDFDESLPAVGDWEFNLRVASSASIGFLPGRPLAFWHQRPSALGADGNSMFAGKSLHEKHDLAVRERHLREWTDRNGIGLPLWMAREVQDLRGRLEQMQDGQQQLLEQNRRLLEDMQAQRELILAAEQRIKEHSLISRVGRVLRRIAPWAFRGR
jgi:glycosyltransferase involved in cell wall biosynthesis